jgi:hypothetical protein
MPAFVIYLNGRRKAVKNLGWLLKHASEVTRIRFIPVDPEGAYGDYDLLVIAETEDGTEYHTLYACVTLAREWFKRPSLRHAQQVWSERPIKIDPGAFDEPAEVRA